jgi:hypothetical protein
MSKKSLLKNSWIGVNPQGRGMVGPQPIRNPNCSIYFNDRPEFQPNLSPLEVLKAGSFGGGYFRDIHDYHDVWKELPEDWLKELPVSTLNSSTYNSKINAYKVRAGVKADSDDHFGLEYWEKQGWIKPQGSVFIYKDPYGWFQWYVRFYQGRRSEDDDRQIKRWLNSCGPNGRWKQNLITKCVKTGAEFDDFTVSPVVRQTLQHWAYRLTRADFDQGVAKVTKKRGNESDLKEVKKARRN